MAADVRHQLHPARIAHQHAAAFLVRQAAPVARFGHAFLVSHVQGRLLEYPFLFAGEQGFVEIGPNVQRAQGLLHMLEAANVRHIRLLVPSRKVPGRCQAGMALSASIRAMRSARSNLGQVLQ